MKVVVYDIECRYVYKVNHELCALHHGISIGKINQFDEKKFCLFKLS